jgi:hypothetical protein
VHYTSEDKTPPKHILSLFFLDAFWVTIWLRQLLDIWLYLIYLLVYKFTFLLYFWPLIKL